MKKLLVFLLIILNSISFGELEDFILNKKEEKNEIKISQELRVTTLDPIKLSDIYSKRAFRYLYETLFEIDIDGNITPKLVEEYKFFNNKELYIKLKEGIKFQDGSVLTSQDVKTSLMRVKERGALREFYKNIEDIKLINKNEFVILLSKEDKYLFEILSHTMSSIVKEKGEKIIGTGKYQVEKLQKDGVVLSKVDEPHKKIIIDRIFSIQDRLLSLFNNNSDIIYDITKFDIERGKRLNIIDEKNIEIKESENIVTTALVFNNKELKFRKAIEGLLYEEAPYILPNEIYGESFKSLNKKESLKNIKKYLATLSKKDRTLELMILNTEEDRVYAENLKKYLAKGGISVKIFPYQVDAFYHKIKNKDFDIALQHLVFNKKYPRISLGKVILYDILDKNLYDEINSYENRIEGEKNSEERNKIFIELVDNISQKLPYIPLEHHPLYILINKNIQE